MYKPKCTIYFAKLMQGAARISGNKA